MSHSDPRSHGSASTRPPRASARSLFDASLELFDDALPPAEVHSDRSEPADPVIRTCVTCGGSGKIRQKTGDAATLIVARALLGKQRAREAFSQREQEWIAASLETARMRGPAALERMVDALDAESKAGRRCATCEGLGRVTVRAKELRHA